MDNNITSVGGARIGLVNATFPFAHLTVTPKKLTLKVTFIGKYDFTPKKVTSIERYGIIPFLGWGIRIHHNVLEYPEKIVYWCFGNPDNLIDKIKGIGFLPVASTSQTVQHNGFAFRWSAIITIIAIWNGLFVLDGWPRPKIPGYFSFLAILLLYLLSMTIDKVEVVKKFFLKPDRDIEEIKPIINLIRLVSGLMVLGFGIMLLLK
jgi:hypothetical protein